jgi:hypothetical protein
VKLLLPRHPSAYITRAAGDGFAAAAHAVHAQIPRVFKNLTSMGHPAWPRARIEALVSTGGTSYDPSRWPRPLGGVARYASIATNACGKAVEQ